MSNADCVVINVVPTHIQIKAKPRIKTYS